MPRRTLAREATVTGVGLHTGAHVTARCVGRGVRERHRLPAHGSGGLSRSAGPALPGPVHRAAHGARRLAGNGGDGRASPRRRRRAPARRSHRGAGRPRAAHRRWLLRAVPRGALRRGHRRAARRAGDLQGHGALPAHRGRQHLRRGAGPVAAAHHHDRVGAPADRAPVGQLRHHAGGVRPRAGAGADVRVRPRGRGAAGSGAGAGCRPGLHPDTLRRRSGRRRAPLARRVRAPQGGRHPRAISRSSAGGCRRTSSRASRATRATSRWPDGSAGPDSASEASRWTSAGSWT